MKQALPTHLQVLILSALLIASYIALVYERYTFSLADPAWMMLATQSLAEDGDLDLKNQMGGDPVGISDQVSIGHRGEWYPLHEWALPILGVPFYLAFSWNGLLLCNVILCLGIALCLYKISSHLTDATQARNIALASFTMSNLLYYSYSFSIDVLGCLLFLSTYLLARHRYYVLAGALFSLLVLSRSFYVVTLPAFLLLIILSGNQAGFKRLLPILTFGASGIPGAGILLLVNSYMFGSWHTTAYQHWHMYDDSSRTIKRISHSFDRPIWTGVCELFSFSETSIWFGAPLLAFGLIFCSFSAWKRCRADFCFFAVATMTLVLLFLKYSGFPGNFGNRYFLILIPFSVLLISARAGKGTTNTGAKGGVVLFLPYPLKLGGRRPVGPN